MRLVPRRQETFMNPQVDPMTLQLLDRQLLAHVGGYNVNLKADRLRSCADLTEFFFQLVRVLQPDLFIEAGAKDASSSKYARKFIPDARIVAFEANPYTFDRFKGGFSKTSVEYLNLALSNEVGSIAFNVNIGTDGAPRADGRGSLMRFDGDFEDISGTQEVTADATTLDIFFENYAYESSALWIDVEGASEMVLGGASATLHKADVAIIEVEDREYWSDQWLRSDVMEYFYEHGLIPLSRDFQSRYLYNIVFVRQSKANIDRVRWALTHHLSMAGRNVRKAHDLPVSETAEDDWVLGLSQKELVRQFAFNARSSIRRRVK